MAAEPVVCQFRVRYSETDQMGTFYNARALEWFEVGRTELLRAIGVPYAQMEEQGVLLPLTEAHVEFLGRARYDDLLVMTTTAEMTGRARLRFDIQIEHAAVTDSLPLGGGPGRGAVVRGWTVHAITNGSGKPTRPPEWLLAALAGQK
ncbi:MAG: thioesterase family protein [Phycisphaerae bacterium]|nr:thioesterase family protein [Phycisphaerae bacterium]